MARVPEPLRRLVRPTRGRRSSDELTGVKHDANTKNVGFELISKREKVAGVGRSTVVMKIRSSSPSKRSDVNPRPGFFLHTGSATDVLNTGAWAGTGRFIRIELWGLTQQRARGEVRRVLLAVIVAAGRRNTRQRCQSRRWSPTCRQVGARRLPSGILPKYGWGSAERVSAETTDLRVSAESERTLRQMPHLQRIRRECEDHPQRIQISGFASERVLADACVAQADANGHAR